MKNLALIPARGGSQRIPHKNIRDFAGRPIIAYAVEAAIQAELFDRVVVTTDDPDVADVALSVGAEVPFERPAAIADDFTPIVDVVLHALAELETAGSRFENVCTIFATAPFVRAADLRTGLRLIEMGHPAAVAVTEFEFPIFRAFELTAEGELHVLWPEHAATRSQDLPVTLHDAGQFYWTRVPVVCESRSLWPPGMQPVRLPRHRVQDIDTPGDWERAELLYAALRDHEREVS